MNSVITKEPVFCFTCDIDWAPEFVIEEVLDTFADYELPPTPFITHKSDTIEQCFEHEKQKVCAHPNFFPAYLLGYLNGSPEKWKTIAFFHGSPWDPLEEYIYPDSNNFDDFVPLHWDYIFLGHTHYPMFKQAGNVNIVNPGSCGQPRDGDLRASAAVFDFENELIVIIKEFYDVQSTIKEAWLAGVAPVAIRKLERGVRYDKG